MFFFFRLSLRNCHVPAAVLSEKERGVRDASWKGRGTKKTEDNNLENGPQIGSSRGRLAGHIRNSNAKIAGEVILIATTHLSLLAYINYPCRADSIKH